MTTTSVNSPTGAAQANTALSRTFPSFRVRQFLPTDVPAVCSWVTTRQALSMVSGDEAECLTPEILDGWLARAQATIVVADEADDRPVGFCTVSTQEAANMPVDYIEICHLIVDPRFRNLFIGSRLVRRAKLWANDFGYRYVCGRVVLENQYTLALARQQKFGEITGGENWLSAGFRWFKFCVDGRPANEELGHNEAANRG